jgi:hypothetical protein
MNNCCRKTTLNDGLMRHLQSMFTVGFQTGYCCKGLTKSDNGFDQRLHIFAGGSSSNWLLLLNHLVLPPDKALAVSSPCSSCLDPLGDRRLIAVWPGSFPWRSAKGEWLLLATSIAVLHPCGYHRKGRTIHSSGMADGTLQQSNEHQVL